MRKENNYIATGLLFLLAHITKAYNNFTTFTVIDGIHADHAGQDEYIITYNDTKYNFDLEYCRQVVANFSVDPSSATHNTDLPEYALSKAHDLFFWSADSLRAVFNNTLNTTMMSSKCILQPLANGAKQLLTCNNSDNDLAVVYGSSLRFREGLIGFANAGANLVECINDFNGFIVTDCHYQRNTTSPTPSLSSKTPVSPAITSSPTPFESDDANILWASIAGATFFMLAIVGICFAHKGIRKSLEHGISRMFSRTNNNKKTILPLKHLSNVEQANTYDVGARF